MTNAVAETKAQKSERLKRAMNPWEGLAEVSPLCARRLRLDFPPSGLAHISAGGECTHRAMARAWSAAKAARDALCRSSCSGFGFRTACCDPINCETMRRSERAVMLEAPPI